MALGQLECSADTIAPDHPFQRRSKYKHEIWLWRRRNSAGNRKFLDGELRLHNQNRAGGGELGSSACVHILARMNVLNNVQNGVVNGLVKSLIQSGIFDTGGVVQMEPLLQGGNSTELELCSFFMVLPASNKGMHYELMHYEPSNFCQADSFSVDSSDSGSDNAERWPLMALSVTRTITTKFSQSLRSSNPGRIFFFSLNFGTGYESTVIRTPVPAPRCARLHPTHLCAVMHSTSREDDALVDMFTRTGDEVHDVLVVGVELTLSTANNIIQILNNDELNPNVDELNPVQYGK
ncbi:hypothetical protein B0H10DRAFT_2190693 [Mycena sp. CBHHK59/15]|nr:hypothetical protein B0H10DRAFT_2190693 [Mycena sp. CBHHK59/15]